MGRLASPLVLGGGLTVQNPRREIQTLVHLAVAVIVDAVAGLQGAGKHGGIAVVAVRSNYDEARGGRFGHQCGCRVTETVAVSVARPVQLGGGVTLRFRGVNGWQVGAFVGAGCQQQADERSAPHQFESSAKTIAVSSAPVSSSPNVYPVRLESFSMNAIASLMDAPSTWTTADGFSMQSWLGPLLDPSHSNVMRASSSQTAPPPTSRCWSRCPRCRGPNRCRRTDRCPRIRQKPDAPTGPT